MAYDSKQAARADGRCGYELDDGRGYCGQYGVGVFLEGGSLYCRHHVFADGKQAVQQYEGARKKRLEKQD
jgi:hypothetical protein